MIDAIAREEFDRIVERMNVPSGAYAFMVIIDQARLELMRGIPHHLCPAPPKAAPFKAPKTKRKPLPKKPRQAREPGKIYTAAEREKLIQSRPDLQNEMEVSPQDK